MVEHPPVDGDLDEGDWLGSDAGFGRLLTRVTEWLAVCGGALILVVMVITVISVTGRALLGRPVVGDYEITELACGIAVFLFFPYTQVTHGNIVAEFFTARLSRRNQSRLELIHTAIFAGFAAFLCWRMILGGFDKYHSLATSMLLGLPVWISYAAGVLALGLLTVVCIWIVARLVAAERR